MLGLEGVSIKHSETKSLPERVLVSTVNWFSSHEVDGVRVYISFLCFLVHGKIGKLKIMSLWSRHF
jgi:hypothetical protein